MLKVRKTSKNHSCSAFQMSLVLYTMYPINLKHLPQFPDVDFPSLDMTAPPALKEATVAILSTGPVGPSDGLGYSDAKHIIKK